MRAFLMRLVTTFLTSRAWRDWRRTAHALRRKLKGAEPTVYYFHQSDDPYSHLTVQLVAKLKSRYRIKLIAQLVSAPDDAAAPERKKLKHYALRDAARVAHQYALTFVANAKLPHSSRVDQAAAALVATIKDETFAEIAPQISAALWSENADLLASFATDEAGVSEALAAGDKNRKTLGHYLSAMLYFEGEWYWGVDRLHHLEKRLKEIGLDTAPPDTPMLAGFRGLSLATKPASKSKPVIEYWFSFRSPYSCISARRMWKLARHYDCELQLRFILPMVMRGLPVPPNKRMYIMLDTKREAECVGEPYGTIVDPVGAGAARALAVLHHAIPLGHGEAFAELGFVVVAHEIAVLDHLAVINNIGCLVL